MSLHPHACPLADWGNPLLNKLAAFNRWFCTRWHRLPQDLCIALPEKGPALLASNHISGLDALLLIAASPRPLRFLIAVEEYNRFGLHRLFHAVGCIPVDRSGRPEVALRRARSALIAGEVVAIFPQGRIEKPGQNLPHKPGIYWLAEQTGAPILHVQLSGIKGLGKNLGAILPRSQAMITTDAAKNPRG